jgi:hypothetical protein
MRQGKDEKEMTEVQQHRQTDKQTGRQGGRVTGGDRSVPRDVDIVITDLEVES